MKFDFELNHESVYFSYSADSNWKCEFYFELLRGKFSEPNIESRREWLEK